MVAQSVQHGTLNPRVIGLITLGEIKPIYKEFAMERHKLTIAETGQKPLLILHCLSAVQSLPSH